jgi:molybdopterin-guanine dinucleotide biosynthesis protein A
MPDGLTGVVLAGGRSRRMERDKAFLTVEGVTLVRRQAALLVAVGCSEVLISGRPGVDYGVPGTRIVLDPGKERGPLGGLVAALRTMKHERLVVLAVDLPHMTVDFLQRAIAAGTADVSVVPHGEHGFEPLAACYARSLRSPAEAALSGGRLSLQALMADAEVSGLVKRLPLSPVDERLFENWNSPEDVRPESA